mmetsp:Transcript_48901/g.163200  ORF Transcript_48901/g.163200 Transcript_48901/m.163200 type:complete len:369 (-) Transcript_48901:133-1239(-)
MPARARRGGDKAAAGPEDSQLHGNKPTCQGKLLVLRGSSAPRAFFGPRKKFQRARKRPFAAGAGCSGVSGSGGRPASRSRVGREESPSSATMPATSAPAESPPSCPLSSSSCGSSGGASCFDAFEDSACLRPCTVACPGPPSGPARPPPSHAAASGVGVSSIPASGCGVDGGVGGVSPSLGAAAAAALYAGQVVVAPVRRTGKWGVPAEVFPAAQYPPYAKGGGYLLSIDVARQIVPEIQSGRSPLLSNVEDAMIGIAADRLAMSATGLNHHFRELSLDIAAVRAASALHCCSSDTMLYHKPAQLAVCDACWAAGGLEPDTQAAGAVRLLLRLSRGRATSAVWAWRGRRPGRALSPAPRDERGSVPGH